MRRCCIPRFGVKPVASLLRGVPGHILLVHSHMTPCGQRLTSYSTALTLKPVSSNLTRSQAESIYSWGHLLSFCLWLWESSSSLCVHWKGRSAVGMLQRCEELMLVTDEIKWNGVSPGSEAVGWGFWGVGTGGGLQPSEFCSLCDWNVVSAAESQSIVPASLVDIHQIYSSNPLYCVSSFSSMKQRTDGRRASGDLCKQKLTPERVHVSLFVNLFAPSVGLTSPSSPRSVLWDSPSPSLCDVWLIVSSAAVKLSHLHLWFCRHDNTPGFYFFVCSADTGSHSQQNISERKTLTHHVMSSADPVMWRKVCRVKISSSSSRSHFHFVHRSHVDPLFSSHFLCFSCLLIISDLKRKSKVNIKEKKEMRSYT